MSRIHRQHSFGDGDLPGSVVISKTLERRITQGDVDLEELEAQQCDALVSTLKLLIDACDNTAPVDAVEVGSCHNVRISYSPQIVQQLTEK